MVMERLEYYFSKNISNGNSTLKRNKSHSYIQEEKLKYMNGTEGRKMNNEKDFMQKLSTPSADFSFTVFIQKRHHRRSLLGTKHSSIPASYLLSWEHLYVMVYRDSPKINW